MPNAEIFRPAELSPADIAAWRRLAAARPEFASPLLDPDFAIAVGRIRTDARVAIWREGRRAVAFLAFHQRPFGLARPIGAPMSDYHALIAEDGFDGHAALTEAGLGTFKFWGLLDPMGMFAEDVALTRPAYVIELDSDAETYLEALRAASPKRFKNYRRLDSKLAREVGPLRMVANDLDPAAFDQLITWKREQLARTGAADFLAPDWTRRLMNDLFVQRTGRLQGLMINLYVGDKLAAGHFGVRAGSVYHPWIAATDPALGAWSPGQIFMLRTIAAMPQLGLTTYDLGPGHDSGCPSGPWAVETV